MNSIISWKKCKLSCNPLEPKILLVYTENNNDCLSIIATAMNLKQFLEVPEMSSGTEYETSLAVFDTLQI